MELPMEMRWATLREFDSLLTRCAAEFRFEKEVITSDEGESQFRSTVEVGGLGTFPVTEAQIVGSSVAQA